MTRGRLTCQCATACCARCDRPTRGSSRRLGSTARAGPPSAGAWPATSSPTSGVVVGTAHRRQFHGVEDVPAYEPGTRLELTPTGARALVLTNGVHTVVLPRRARRPAPARPPLEVLEGHAIRAAQDRAELEAP